MEKKMRQIILISFLCLCIIYIAVYFLFIKPYGKNLSIFNTIPILDLPNISQGYTLITPYSRILTETNEKGYVYLADLLGKSVKTWSTTQQALYSKLMKNGNLFVIMESPTYSQLFPPGGNTGTLQELDWNSNVVWEYKNEALHHDVELLPNGNIAAILWEKTPTKIASQIQGGAKGSTLPTKVIWSDNIIELDRNKNVVWSWHSYEHLDPQKDTLGPLMPQFAWTYTNGISYTERNPIDGTPAYLLSMRSISTVMIVRRSDGNIIWRSPKNKLSLQHDPTFLPNGNILVFDNGYDRIPDPYPVLGSRAVEINPLTNKIVWQFDGGKGVTNRIQFFSSVVGGAQRLPNGNTLITDGPKGHIFEVTNDGRVVWDLLSPFDTRPTGPFPNKFIFKTRRYTSSDIPVLKKLSPPVNGFKFRLFKLLRILYPN